MKLVHVTKRGDSEIHRAGCSHTKRVDKKHYLEFEAQTRAQAITELGAEETPVTFAPCVKGLE
jgi:hypothetical protein